MQYKGPFMRLVLSGFLIIGALAVLPAHKARAQEDRGAGVVISSDKTLMNQNTVKIVSGKLSGTHLPIVEDMATVLDNGDKLRVLAIIGKGTAQNVADVLYLKGIDMGITHANVMAYFKRLGSVGPNLDGRLVYITTLFNEELHVVARRGIKDFSQLAGQAVNFGEAGTGTRLTAKLVFDSLKIKVKPVYLAQSDALEKVRSGEIAATILLAGKPAGALQKLRNSSDFSLLPVPFEEALEKDYLPSTLTNKDYPDLIAEGDSIDTIAVTAVLASYNWNKGGDRYRRLKTFVDAFFTKFPQFRKKPRHPKWGEVNLEATLRGWKRFPYAQEWLNSHRSARAAKPAAANVVAAGPTTFRDFIGSTGSTGAAPVDKALFAEFMKWKQSQGGAVSNASSGLQVPSSAPRAPSSPAAKPAATGSRLW